MANDGVRRERRHVADDVAPDEALRIGDPVVGQSLDQPPSATALNPWFTASNHDMPASRSASMQARVSAV